MTGITPVPFQRRSRQAGLSLIELMVALVLGLLVSGVLLGVFQIGLLQDGAERDGFVSP